jgi:hypothetical protein
MAQLKERKVFHRLLPGNIAFHSAKMDAIKQPVLDALAFLDRQVRGSSPAPVSKRTGSFCLLL